VLEIKIWVIDYKLLSFQTCIICKYHIQETGMNMAFANETFVPELWYDAVCKFVFTCKLLQDSCCRNYTEWLAG